MTVDEGDRNPASDKIYEMMKEAAKKKRQDEMESDPLLDEVSRAPPIEDASTKFESHVLKEMYRQTKLLTDVRDILNWFKNLTIVFVFLFILGLLLYLLQR